MGVYPMNVNVHIMWPLDPAVMFSLQWCWNIKKPLRKTYITWHAIKANEVFCYAWGDIIVPIMKRILVLNYIQFCMWLQVSFKVKYNLFYLSRATKKKANDETWNASDFNQFKWSEYKMCMHVDWLLYVSSSNTPQTFLSTVSMTGYVMRLG